jgi:flagellar basal-body rod protein FlgG
MESVWAYQEVVANNIANANTIAYKRQTVAMESFPDILLSQQTPTLAPLAARIDNVVGQIGSGRFVVGVSTDFATGAYASTKNELDLVTEKGFFVITGQDGVEVYTRDGRFGRGGDGTLVNAQGYRVQGVDGQPITLVNGAVVVETDGTVKQHDQVMGKIRVVDFRSSQLERAGVSYFTATSAGVDIEGPVRQGYLEGSNTSMVDEMTTLAAVRRVYQANQSIIAKLDGTLDLAAGQLGQFGR